MSALRFLTCRRLQKGLKGALRKWLVKSASETQVDTISVRTEGRLMFLIPTELAVGNYHLEVRRAYISPSDIRVARLNSTITVS